MTQICDLETLQAYFTGGRPGDAYPRIEHSHDRLGRRVDRAGVGAPHEAPGDGKEGTLHVAEGGVEAAA